MQKLTLSVADYTEIPNAKIVYFEGDFDGYAEETITELQSQVDQCGNGTVLIFDFSKLNYLNSYAIGQLVSWHNTISTKGGKIVIVGINKNIQDIFSVLGIESVFKTYPSLEDVKKDLTGA